MDQNLWNRTDAQLSSGQYDVAVAELERDLAGLGVVEYQPVVDQDFAKNYAHALETLKGIISSWGGGPNPGPSAVYIEMNGFDINWDVWYCSAFGYAEDGGLDDIEWLCDMQFGGGGSERMVLAGMEAAQQSFAWYHQVGKHQRRADIRRAHDIAILLVLSKFVRYVGRVLRSGEGGLGVPVYATVHDCDLVARFAPEG